MEIVKALSQWAEEHQVDLEPRGFGSSFVTEQRRINNKQCAYLQFESANVMSQVTAWSSGECDVLVLDRNSGQERANKHYSVSSENDLCRILDSFLDDLKADLGES